MMLFKSLYLYPFIFWFTKGFIYLFLLLDIAYALI